MGIKNTVVFEYTRDGSRFIATGFSTRGVGHAERVIWAQLVPLGVEPSHVTRIYSELEPCSLPGGYCRSWIARMFANAALTWSFSYGNEVDSRRAGVEALKAAVARVLERGSDLTP